MKPVRPRNGSSNLGMRFFSEASNTIRGMHSVSDMVPTNCSDVPRHIDLAQDSVKLLLVLARVLPTWAQ